MFELSLVLSFIDRLIDLVKKRSEIDRAQFKDFVEPAFATFEGLHKDYIDSLTRYSERLADKQFKMDLDHPVFRDIEMDSLKSEHLRIKLADFKPADAPKKLQPFLTTIDFYLRGISASGDRAEFIDGIAAPRMLDLTPADLEKGIGRLGPEEWNDRVGGGGNFSFVFADPLREALRQQLVGFDASLPANEDEEWKLITGAVFGLPDSDELPSIRLSQEERRMQCAGVIRLAIECFQQSYAVVSHEYSALRSQLLSAA